MKPKTLLKSLGLLAVASAALFITACSTTGTPDDGTHRMGGRSGELMADDMMPGHEH